MNSPQGAAERIPVCHNCQESLSFKWGTNIGRSETCTKCGNDLRVCLNCVHYDPRSYNECREPQAERVVEKNRRNFCDYFSIGRDSSGAKADPKADALKKLDDLFK